MLVTPAPACQWGTKHFPEICRHQLNHGQGWTCSPSHLAPLWYLIGTSHHLLKQDGSAHANQGPGPMGPLLGCFPLVPPGEPTLSCQCPPVHISFCLALTPGLWSLFTAKAASSAPQAPESYAFIPASSYPRPPVHMGYWGFLPTRGTNIPSAPRAKT